MPRMTTNETSPGSAIDIASIPNLRELGGYATNDGRRIRDGVLFRSTQLSKLADADRTAFAALGIRTVFDLRTEAERTAEPDPELPGTENVVVDVLAGSADAAPAQLLEVLSDPEAAMAQLGGGRAIAQFSNGYREIVSLDSALAGYGRFFTEIAKPGVRPALFHCTTGKDRTGWAAAATLLLLGVPEDVVRQDYLLSNTYLLPAFQPVFDRFASLGGDPALLRPVVGVDDAYLDAALDEMRTRFGTIEGYFADGLGIDAAGQAALRDVLLGDG